MSIFKDTFTSEVQAQLKIRQNAIKNRTPASIQYANSRNAWIRMSSSVNVSDTNEIAKQYVLQGGVLKPEGGLKSGVGGADSAYTNSGTRGIRPMPGINSIDIKSKSAYGSLREVVVQFQCWDITQLENLELLYMRPGYTVLVEWGWLPYLQSEDNIEYNITQYDIINKVTPKEEIWKDLFNKSKASGGNYDAMFGYIKNYSWSARPDGGYDCTTTIISIGEIIESLKTNYLPSISGILKGPKGMLFPNVTTDVTKKYKINILAGLFAELYEIALKKIPNPGEQGSQYKIFDANNKNKTYNFYLRQSAIQNFLTDDKDKLVNPQSSNIQIYITIKSLIDILNKYIILKDTENNIPIIEFSLTERVYDKETTVEKDLLCLTHPLQISVDPSICLIRNDIWSAVEVSQTEEKTKNSIKGAKYLTNLEKFVYDSKKELGIIGNIYVNLQFLYGLSLDNNLESQDKKEKQEISVYDFLKNILYEISSATGNVNNFDIHVDPIDSKARIIDINYANDTDKDTVYNDSFTLEMHNLSSTVRSYKLESQIFQEQSTMVSIAAQSQNGALGTDSNSLGAFNKKLTDRIIPLKDDPNASDKADVAKAEKFKSLEDLVSTIYDFFGDTTSSYVFWSQASYDIDSSGKYRGALRDLISGLKSLTNSPSKNNNIIPTKLSLEMDGIGGLVIGHIFKIPNNLLPKGYKGGELGSRLGQIITGIGHSVSNSDWTTSIEAQTIILDNPTGGINFDYKDLLESLNKAISTGDGTDFINQFNKNKYDISSLNPNLPSQSGPIIKPNPFGINSNSSNAASLIAKSAKDNIGFNTAGIQGVNGNLGCAAAVSVLFTNATGRKITSPDSIVSGPIKSSDIEQSTEALYNKMSNDSKNWRKRENYKEAQPGDIIITPKVGNQYGHVGIVSDSKSKNGGFNIISNSSSGHNGSKPGTVQQNYNVNGWGKVASRNPSQTAAFEYIGPTNK